MPVYQLLVLTPSPGDASRFARLLQQTEHTHFTVTPAASVAAGLAALGYPLKAGQLGVGHVR